MQRKTVLVTGGGKGVGRGISQRFLERGAEVVICGRQAPDELPRHGERAAHFHACDVRDLEQIAALWHCDRRFSPLMPAPRRATLYAGWLDAVRRVATQPAAG